MGKELNPKIAVALIAAILLLIGAGAYLVFRPAGSSVDVAKVKIHEPRGFNLARGPKGGPGHAPIGPASAPAGGPPGAPPAQ